MGEIFFLWNYYRTNQIQCLCEEGLREWQVFYAQTIIACVYLVIKANGNLKIVL